MILKILATRHAREQSRGREGNTKTTTTKDAMRSNNKRTSRRVLIPTKFSKNTHTLLYIFKKKINPLFINTLVYDRSPFILSLFITGCRFFLLRFTKNIKYLGAINFERDQAVIYCRCLPQKCLPPCTQYSRCCFEIRFPAGGGGGGEKSRDAVYEAR